MTTNLAGTTRFKVSQLYTESIARIYDRRDLLFVGHRTGVNVIELSTGKVEQMKLDKSEFSGPFSCFTISDELIFFCSGSKIVATSLNLKIIFELDTYLAVDRIDKIHVHGYRVFLVSSSMVNEFLIGGIQLMNKRSRITQSPTQKSEDIQQQVFDCEINHSLLITLTAEKPFLLLLKSTNQIDIFEKKQNTTEASFKTDSPPTFAMRYPENEQNFSKVLVGTMSGEILYLEISRKAIKKLWSITDSKGKINSMCSLANGGFLVAKDKKMEFWTKNKEIIKTEEMQEKIICTYFLPYVNKVFYGTSNGTLVEMVNYEQYIRESKKKAQNQTRQQVLKEIEHLRIKKDMLTQKLKANKAAREKKSQEATTVKKINVKDSLTIDYTNLCYLLELQSDEKINKVICLGPVTLLEDSQLIFFEGKNKGENVYTLRYENETQIQIKIKYPEVFCQLDRLTVLVYFCYETRVHNISIDLKQLSLHHKIETKSFDENDETLNKLQVKGNFKFEMKMWMNGLFNGFKTEEIEQVRFMKYIKLQEGLEVACYESIVTKNKIMLKFKAGFCLVLTESVIPLLIIKKKLQQKSREKDISLSFDTVTTPESIKKFVQKIEVQMMNFNKIKREYDLLPGLLELKNQLSLQKNEEMLGILERRQEIGDRYRENSRLQAEIQEKMIDLYRSYKVLNGKSTSEFEEKSMKSSIENWSTSKIVNLICG